MDASADAKAGTLIEERPLIYHLDGAAMHPNIILTNRAALWAEMPSLAADIWLSSLGANLCRS